MDFVINDICLVLLVVSGSFVWLKMVELGLYIYFYVNVFEKIVYNILCKYI